MLRLLCLVIVFISYLPFAKAYQPWNCAPGMFSWGFPKIPLEGGRFTIDSVAGDPLMNPQPLQTGDALQGLLNIIRFCDGPDFATDEFSSLWPEPGVSIPATLWLVPVRDSKVVDGNLTFVSPLSYLQPNQGVDFRWGYQMPGVPTGMIDGKRGWKVATIDIYEGAQGWYGLYALDESTLKIADGMHHFVVGNFEKLSNFDISKFKGYLGQPDLSYPTGDYWMYLADAKTGFIFLASKLVAGSAAISGGSVYIQGCSISNIYQKIGNINLSELSGGDPDGFSRGNKIALPPIELTCSGSAKPSLYVQALSGLNDLAEQTVISKNISSSLSAAKGDIGIELTMAEPYEACYPPALGSERSKICETYLQETDFEGNRTVQFNFFANYVKFGSTPISAGEVESKFYLTINYN